MARQGRSLAALAVVLAVVWPSGSAAQDARADAPSDPIVVVNGDVTVERNQRVEAVIVVRGNVVVEGEVTGTVFVGRGRATVNGTVDDEVVVMNGRAVVGPGAEVGGDVVSSRRPDVAEGAQVDGDIRRDVYGLEVGLLGGLAVFLWLAVGLSLLGLGLLFVLLAPRAAAAATDTARVRRGPSAVVGIVASIALPTLAVLVMVTLVGIPLGLVALGSLALVYALGWVVSAMTLGRAVAKNRSGLVAFIAGWAILRVIALIPGIGALVSLAATVYGLGALLLAGWSARSEPAPDPDPEPERETEPEASERQE